MKKISKIILIVVALLLSIAFLAVGLFYYIPIAGVLIGSKVIGFLKLSVFVSWVGVGLFTSISSILAGALLTFTALLIAKRTDIKKQRPIKVKKAKEPKMAKWAAPQFKPQGQSPQDLEKQKEEAKKTKINF